MATYNGAKFLREQLESIVHQTYIDWRLIIRDDGSTDETTVIINDYCKADRRISVITGGAEHGSAIVNFGELFGYAFRHANSYVMFADQDDIWHKAKIADSIAYMAEVECREQPNTPILVYSNFQYINESGHHINQELKMPPSLPLSILFNGNYAYGCTMILNRALVDRIVSIPSSAENHDYWIALVAGFFGKTFLNPKKLLNYRQHANNVSSTVNNRELSARFKRYVTDIEQMLPDLSKRINMIALFRTVYAMELDESKRLFIDKFLSSFRKSGLSLFFFMVRNKFRKIGLNQTIAHYLIILRLRKKIIASVR